MKRAILLVCGVLAACKTQSANVDDGRESPEQMGEQADPTVPDVSTPPFVSEPPAIVATETGNPPAASCAPARFYSSNAECVEMAAQLQARYAAPRQIRYVGADWMNDAVPFRIAEDPFSLSRCVAQEHVPAWARQASSPVCLCSSASDDVTPAALGRFGESADGGLPNECGQVRPLDSELGWACLYTGGEFPGCDPANVDSCADVCSVFRERALTHYASVLDVQIRRARLVPNPANPCGAGRCELVVEIEDQCFANRVGGSGCERELITGPSQDCALSDDELLAEAGYPPAPESAVPPAQCNPEPQDGGLDGSTEDGGPG